MASTPGSFPADGGANSWWDSSQLQRYIVIENLEIRSARAFR